MDYTIIVDTREQKTHITKAFKKNNIDFEKRKINTGDYAVEVEGELLPIRIERKFCIDEIVGNLLEKKGDFHKNRFMRELDRIEAEKIEKFIILIEDANFYKTIMEHKYRSKANPLSIRGLLLSLEAKYPQIQIVGIEREYAASYINSIFKYYVKEHLKKEKEIYNNELGK